MASRRRPSAAEQKQSSKPTPWAFQPLRPWPKKRAQMNGKPASKVDRGAPRYVVPSTAYVPGRFPEVDEFRRQVEPKS
jgi:hypothetical protein